jgi:hypothetical protein
MSEHSEHSGNSDKIEDRIEDKIEDILDNLSEISYEYKSDTFSDCEVQTIDELLKSKIRKESLSLNNDKKKSCETIENNYFKECVQEKYITIDNKELNDFLVSVNYQIFTLGFLENPDTSLLELVNMPNIK